MYHESVTNIQNNGHAKTICVKGQGKSVKTKKWEFGMRSYLCQPISQIKRIFLEVAQTGRCLLPALLVSIKHIYAKQ